MTRCAILEYARAVRERYLRSSRKGKTKTLDEFVATAHLHRKAAIRLLNRQESTARPGRRRGRRQVYGLEVIAALKIVWEASDRLCSRRLCPFLGELVQILVAKGELKVSPETEVQLGRMSPSTVDRMTRRWRTLEPRRGLATTKPGTLLRNAIPIKTFTEWQDTRPGFLEADLVAHCGQSAEGFYLTTLSAVDVATGWCEPVAVWGKGQERVGGGVQRVRERLPMPLLGLDSDNGSEFINRGMYDYCRRNQITFTRSRANKKNDCCHVEQKNWCVVRRVVGYDRFSSKAAYDALDNVYILLRLYVNFFQPVRKLIGKSWHGAKVHKVYDTAQTPYQRLIASGALTEDKKETLAGIYAALNPAGLLRQMRQALLLLWSLAEREYNQHRLR